MSDNLIENKSNLDVIYTRLISNRIPIIPIAVQSGVKNRFSKEFGKQHCISREIDNLDKYYKELGGTIKRIIDSR